MSAPVVVVTGPPGAGKSTVAELLVHRWSRSALVAGDEFFAFLREGYIAPWLPESSAQNGIVLDAAAAATATFARGGITVVYEGVVGPWFLAPFAAAVGVRPLHYVVILPSEPACLARVRTRAGHGFTDLDAARHMYREFAEAEVDPRHVLRPASADDVSTVVDAVAALVASGRALVT